MRRHPISWLAAAVLASAPLSASADPAVATRVEVVRAQDGARVLFKLPKPCQLVDESAAEEAKKKTVGQTDVQYLAGYWCYADSEHSELSGVVVVTYQSS